MVPETFHCVKEPKHERAIHKLEHDGRLITDSEEIVAVMQKWYEHTAEKIIPQLETLAYFMTRQGLELPQLDEDQQAMLEEEFTVQEVKTAISEANDVSAPPWPLWAGHLLFQTFIHVHPHSHDSSVKSACFCSGALE
jgi:hypothetical protein